MRVRRIGSITHAGYSHVTSTNMAWCRMLLSAALHAWRLLGALHTREELEALELRHSHSRQAVQATLNH